MSAAAVAQTIQFILAPVVMVSSCAILLTGFLGRYAAINDRMRAMNSERFELLRAVRAPGPADELVVERLKEIDHQLPDLLHRHLLVRDSVLVLYLAIVIFVASMFVIAISALESVAWIAVVALGLFLLGTALLLGSLVLTAVEVRASHQAIAYEVARSLGLRGPPGDGPP